MVDVLLDVDGPLADFTGSFLRAVAEATGNHHTHDEVDQYDISASLGLSKSDSDRIYAGWVKREGFCSAIAPHHGSRRGVDLLRKVANVYACTTPMYGSPFWMPERERWLEEHMGFHPKEVIFTSAKHLFRAGMLVDDRVDHVASFAIAHPESIAVLWTMRNNEKTRVAAGTRFEASTVWTNDWEVIYKLASFGTRKKLKLEG